MKARGARRAARRQPRGAGPVTGVDPGRAGEPAVLPGERWWLSGLLAAAFGLRLFQVWDTFLVPDEAIFFDIARATDLASVYRASTEQAHPPFYFLLLHFWTGLFRSDLALRLPSILMAVASTGLFYLWARRRSGPLAAFATAALLALSPSLVHLTSEVRQYSLLLLFLSGALLAASPPEGLPSGRRFATLAALLVAASSTHYAGLLFAAALVSALAFDLWRGAASRRTWLGLACVAIALALLAALVWTSHVRALRAGHLAADAMNGWLRSCYWKEGGLAGFLASASAGVFAFLLGLSPAGIPAALAGFVAVLVRARREAGTAVLLAAPFVVAFAAAALRVYPLGATRHSAWLLPAAAAALCLPLAAVRPGSVRWLLPALAVLLPLWTIRAQSSPLSAIPRADRQRQQLDGLLKTLSERVGPADVVFLDTQTATLLRRYLGGVSGGATRPGPLFHRETIGSMNVWVSRTWLHDAPTFVRELALLREEAELARGRRVRVVNGGSASRLLPQLASAYPRAPVTSPAGFGGSLWTFEIALP